MNDFYISSVKAGGHIHFIGIGGISMSALAQICIKSKYVVSGSDINETHITRRLKELGATVFTEHSAQNVCGADLVVYTAAVKNTNPELEYAVKKGIKAVERSVFLGAVMRDYECSICVAGTHGKTTTTSMMTHALLSCECDPTVMLGGELDVIGGNMRIGNSEYFLTEACEYHCSFLEFFPKIAIITNVEADHLDYFKDIEHIKSVFAKFAQIPDKDGAVVVCGDDKNAMECIGGCRADVLTYGFGEKNRFRPENLTYKEGCGEFDVKYGNKTIHIALSVAGEHNVLNALACIAAGYALGLDGDALAEGIEGFKFVHRRFERVGSVHGGEVIDDYAHHPTEIVCTLKTARNICKNKLYVVFQPHTYTRTMLLIDEFEKAFDEADEIIVTDIYAAREKDTGLIHARDLVERLKKRGKKAYYIKEFDEIAEKLGPTLCEGDVLITMGAGNVYKVGKMLADKN